ncbi:OLC1v1000221C1 [Oldenlandia corymbosa var. corymbosa]|uniref:OLC1v1000221C1 n=1 Tax=Oldenlandia corymbosa var. corymbosa TaxID=529605 RepID=A0AAV1D3C3_OLDCO|nr:OLC1v1000221C1 [Oldenlandia corymbosa var. corymbosa]
MEWGFRSTAGNGANEVASPYRQDGAASSVINRAAESVATYYATGQLFVISSHAFDRLCISVAKGIDFAIAHGEIPTRSRFIAPMLMEMYRASQGGPCLAAIKVLTMSVQSACKLEWFTNQDRQALLKICREQDCKFYVDSIPITATTVSPGQNKISLFTVREDILKTYWCTLVPPEANILLNGQNVKLGQRQNDRGRQPIDVTSMTKFGVNSLRAFGYFNADLLVVLAVTSDVEPGLDSELRLNFSPSASTESGQNQEMKMRDSLKQPTLRRHNNGRTTPRALQHLLHAVSQSRSRSSRPEASSSMRANPVEDDLKDMQHDDSSDDEEFDVMMYLSDN